MNINELPEEMQEGVNALKHGSYTIECEVKEALEEAGNIQEFEEAVRTKMTVEIAEACGAVVCFSGRPESFLVVNLKTPLTPEIMERLEDSLKGFLNSMSIKAVIESTLTGNTTVVEGAV